MLANQGLVSLLVIMRHTYVLHHITNESNESIRIHTNPRESNESTPTNAQTRHLNNHISKISNDSIDLPHSSHPQPQPLQPPQPPNTNTRHIIHSIPFIMTEHPTSNTLSQTYPPIPTSKTPFIHYARRKRSVV